MLILGALIPLLLSVLIAVCSICMFRASLNHKSLKRWLYLFVLDVIASILFIFIDIYTNPAADPAAAGGNLAAKGILAVFGFYSMILAAVSFFACIYVLIKKQHREHRSWAVVLLASFIVFLIAGYMSHSL